MTEAATTEPARVDPRYYVDGATWERDIARRNRNSRALAWIVATVMTVVAVAALGTLALLVRSRPTSLIWSSSTRRPASSR